MSGTEVITFGCRLNAYESEVIRGLAAEAALTDAVIVNTCAVTAEAECQAGQAIRRARRRRPDARIIVTGCAAQLDPGRFAAMPEVDRVVGNREKLTASAFRPDVGARVLVDDIMAMRQTSGHPIGGHLIDGFRDRGRAFVQVQQGCDHRCTFCIIPYARGYSRSVPMGEVVRQVRRMVGAGHREVVLTGVDLTAYGADLPGRPSLGQMVRRLLASVPELPRLRLSSLDVAEADPELWRLIAEEPRLMPHLHLSLQAGNDLILKRMRRRHDRAEAVAFCLRARRLRPGIVLGADLIAGFPTETEAMFRDTLALVDDCGLGLLHVFPYSARRGTPAARMPQLPAPVRKERALRLREKGEAALARIMAGRVGSRARVLVERDGSGRSEHYLPVRLDGALAAAGTIVDARITGVADRALVGKPAV